MNVGDLEVNAFFTTDGKDIWILESCYTVPSCTLRNLITGVKDNFGMNGLTAGRYTKVKMPTKEQSKPDYSGEYGLKHFQD